MRTRNILPITLMVISAFLFNQCEVYREGCMNTDADNYDVAADIDDGSCVYSINPTQENCLPDLEGNLSVTNETNDLLFLFKDVNGIAQYETCIPANAENFIIYIPNSENSAYTLQVWKSSELENKESPDISRVYRQWTIALSSTTLIDERASWIITDSDVNKNSGTLELSYPSFDEYNQEVIYQVDVFLNNKSGTRLASLQPGVSNKKASVDYGVHYLYFRYWYSDPNSSSGETTEIGWEEINNIVINAEHKSSNIKIPTYYSIVGKYGYIKIFNTTDNPIAIYADDKLIESIAKVDGSAEGLSIIPDNNSTKFLIPEDSYSISARTIDGSTTIASFKGVSILQSDTTILYVGSKQKQVSITNNTTETLLLYTETGDYLGKVIEPYASTGIYLVQSTHDSLLVITPDKTKKKKIAAETGVTVSSLNDFVTQNYSITTPWPLLGSNYYQSTDINDNESTTMTASLFNTSSVVLSFEYKVSSEYNYDKFHFSLDGAYKIENESGETDWRNFSTNVSPGNHTLKWIFQKDDMFSVGDDNVEIRNITIN